MDIDENDIFNAVVSFCVETIDEPFLHFSENDLHMNLIEKLNDNVPICHVTP